MTPSSPNCKPKSNPKLRFSRIRDKEIELWQSVQLNSLELQKGPLIYRVTGKFFYHFFKKILKYAS